MTQKEPLPFAQRSDADIPGHWLLARLGKRVLRPGGLELTSRLLAAANIHASVQFGLRVFDCSVAGLGGCPYAKGATGNVATEDAVYLLNGLGLDTGVDLDALVACGAWISAILDRQTSSRVAKALMARGRQSLVP